MQKDCRQIYTAWYSCPFGLLKLGYTENDEGSALVMLSCIRPGIPGWKEAVENEAGPENRKTSFTDEVNRQLAEYFAGNRRTFEFETETHGTEFQEKVWAALRRIPYGETITYKQLAEAVGNPKACRAVGMANHCNPLWIVIPCHRVVGSGGSLTGYAGGTDMKAALLEMECTRKAQI